MDVGTLFRELIVLFKDSAAAPFIIGFGIGGAFAWWFARHLYGQQRSNLEHEINVLKNGHAKEVEFLRERNAFLAEQIEVEKQKMGYRTEEPPKGRRKRG